MRTKAAVLLGRSIAFFSKRLKIGGGSAAPGLYALKIQPDLVEKLVRQIPKNIIITGTNGKTTTSRMLSHFATEAGLKVIRNHTGSNLERGIASTLLQHSSLHLEGVRLNFDLGIWELDEAAFNIVAPKIKPQVVVFLNVFRDQLDRYGEVDIVVKNWSLTVSKLPPETILVINGDDHILNKLEKSFTGKIIRFGVRDYKITGESIEHIKEKENLDFEAKGIRLTGLGGSRFSLFVNPKHPSLSAKTSIINLPLPGIYHIYDFLAAFAAGKILGFDSKKIISSLKDFSPAFGRVERFTLQPQGLQREGFILLIKNPAGATAVLQTIAPQLKENDKLLLALNDNIADGTDVSWIWDGEFEKLKVKSQKPKVICSGIRAYDLANRLKYAGFDTSDILVEPNLEKAFKEAQEGLKGRLFILPTYTAMLSLQGILTKSGLKSHYWKEEK